MTDRCSVSLHTISHRLAERNRCVGTPLQVVPGLDASGASVPPLRLRDLRRLRRAHPVSSPFTAPLPPPQLRHSSPFRRPGSHVRSALPFHHDSTILARAGQTIIYRLDRHTVRLLPRLSACLLTLRKTERTMLPHRPFRLPPSRAENMRTLKSQCILERHHTPVARKRTYMALRKQQNRLCCLSQRW